MRSRGGGDGQVLWDLGAVDIYHLSLRLFRLLSHVPQTAGLEQRHLHFTVWDLGVQDPGAGRLGVW